MKSQVEYGTDIIVGTIFEGYFRWYISEKEIWILDQVKWEREFVDSGYEVGEGDYSDRFNIPILDENNMPKFIQEAQSDFVTTEHLVKVLTESCKQRNNEELSYLIPSLLVDFDERNLISYYPEPLRFEDYVPAGWKGSYSCFIDLIPSPYRYWVVNGNDIFSSLIG